MPALERQSLLDRPKKLPLLIKLSIETIAIIYGHITGLLAWRCITLAAPIPTETATDLFLVFLSSLVSSSGIINVCRHHLYETVERIQQADETTLKAIWHEFSGNNDMETKARVFSLLLKIVGAASEGCISHATVQQVLTDAPEDFSTAFALLCGITACIAFPLVEGSSITQTLQSKISCTVNGEIKNELHFLQPPLLKRILYPDEAIIAIANNQPNFYGHYSINKATIIATNLLTILGSLGIATLAFIDSAELLQHSIQRYSALAAAIPIALLYFIADTTLRAIPTKLTLYGLSVHSPTLLITHNPLTFLFTLLQSITISLIPVIAINSAYWFLMEDVSDYELASSPLAVLIGAGIVGLTRLPLSFYSEGVNLIAIAHQEDGQPLFNWLANTLQFSAVSASVAFQLMRDCFDIMSIAETYAIAGGVNALFSAIRHGLLSACIDTSRDRIWHTLYSPLLRFISDFLIPALFGMATEVLCLYIILPKETQQIDMEDNMSSLAGGVTAGLSALLWRFTAHKLNLFYQAHDATPPKTPHGYIDTVKKTTQSTCSKIGKFFNSCFYSGATADDYKTSTPILDQRLKFTDPGLAPRP